MKRVLPGAKPPKIPGIFNLSDILPDESRPTLWDNGQRNIFFHGSLESEHTTLSVSDEQAAETDGMPQRLRSVEVAGVTGGTVTVQIQVNGRDVFDDTVRPVSDAGPEEVTEIYVFPAGPTIHSIIEATSGTPAGTASVSIDTEPYVLLGKFKPVELKGKDRLFPSRRRIAEALNTQRVPTGADQISRFYAYSYGGTSGLVPSSSSIGGGGGGGGGIRDIPDPRPRTPPRSSTRTIR